MANEMAANTIPTTEFAKTSTRVERLREALLPGLAFEDEIAEALNCSRRTVQRLRCPLCGSGCGGPTVCVRCTSRHERQR
jgi:hypothetical protein